MNSQSACLLVGIPAALFWSLGIWKGRMYGAFFSRVRWIGRADEPVAFWVLAILWGAIALGLLITPALDLLGLRG